MGETYQMTARPLERVKFDPNAALDRDALLTLARERAADETVFETQNAAFWRVAASNNMLDFYYTIMDQSTLKNFAADLNDGVSYQDSHDARKNGWGQSIRGVVATHDGATVPETGEKLLSVEGTFFTLEDQQLGAQNTTAFLNMIRAGVWKDVSVGFYASDFRCSICGQQSFEWWKEDGCMHIPGFTYTAEETGGKATVAFAKIHDGRLLEVSQVYDGATPGASVLKATQLSDNGRLKDVERAAIERRYNIRLADRQQTFSIPELTRAASVAPEPDTTRSEDMGILDGVTPEDYERLTARSAMLDTITSLFGETAAADPVATIRTTLTDLETAKAEVERLTPLAATGERYREDLIEETLKSGVRAESDAFKTDRYKAMLERLDVDDIRLMKEDLDRRGDERLKGSGTTVGGRRTSDTAEPEGPKTEGDQKRRRRGTNSFKA
jgi:hypothetical protein